MIVLRPALLILLPILVFAPAADASAKSLRPASPAMVAKLARLFQSRDRDGNASLSPGEWRAAAPGLRLPRNFSKIDRNRDGAISFSEFARALGRRLPQGTTVPVDRAKRSFARLDANADGKVTYVELDNSDRLGNFEIQDWFDGMDGDGNGAVDLGEWRLPDYSRYVGLPLEAAEALAVLEDRRHRVISIDGEPLIVTMDYSPFRVNFTVVADVVTAATGG
jgi:Ca2+-binding EF-hand superfamily protein